jgi:hypothetical protein
LTASRNGTIFQSLGICFVSSFVLINAAKVDVGIALAFLVGFTAHTTRSEGAVDILIVKYVLGYNAVLDGSSGAGADVV